MADFTTGSPSLTLGASVMKKSNSSTAVRSTAPSGGSGTSGGVRGFGKKDDDGWED